MIDHLADLRSDFSRFHRVDDIQQLDGPQFMEMAWRLSAYGGVIAMRLEAEQQKQEHRAPGGQAPARSQDRKVLTGSAFSAVNADLVDRKRVG